MGAKNDLKMVEWKGEHPFFVTGTCYDYHAYSDYTKANCPLGGVIVGTIKSRLSKVRYCEPKHLKHVSEYGVSPRKGMGWPQEERDKALLTSRFENDVERLSMSWLKTKLVGV
jgi:hypothetical protein